MSIYTRLDFIYVAVWFTLWLMALIQTLHNIFNPPKTDSMFVFGLKMTLMLFCWTVLCSIVLAIMVTQLVERLT